MKKTVALLLALVMVLALCACGQSAAPAASNGNHFDKLTPEVAERFFERRGVVKLAGLGLEA